MSNQENPELLHLLNQAYEYSLALERHARQESAQSQLSPTDLAFFSRMVSFLRYQMPEQLTGDPNYVLDRRQ